ncbi:MAG: hypothetical protein FWD44_03095 [Oscillospiraceae bacterium]|nr:hypothetical protein [Oscillospiraceae bacterium]
MSRSRFRTAALIIVLAACVFTAACTNLLEDSIEVITPHVSAPFERPPIEQISISNLEEFTELLLELIETHEADTTLRYQNFDNDDVQEEINRISSEIMENHPIAVYAVANISLTATRLVAYFEIEIEIEFKRSEEQVQSIITASTQRYMMTQLLEIMSRHEEEAVILTSLQLTREEIIERIIEIYYQNPRRIVMLPFVTVEMFPEEGDDRILEIRFGYTESSEMLRLYAGNLDMYVRQNAGRAVGDTDAEVLLSLVEILMASTVFNEAMAGTINMHGPPNFAATAFGALVRGSAVGEGFAMAFKALCDELRFESRVVLGYMGDTVHAWNIVALDGYYYHIDVAMCVVEGLEVAFLKTDADFEEFYEWDRENTQICNGPLTLYDIIKEEDPLNPEDPGGSAGEPTTGDGQTGDDTAGADMTGDGGGNTGEED